MAVFVCRIGRIDGTVITRTIEGVDEAAVRLDVTRQGGKLFSIQAETKGAKGSLLSLASGDFSLPSLGSLRRRRTVKGEEFLIFNQELVALLKAGLPIVSGLEILLERQKNEEFRRILSDVREQLISGVALSDAILSHGDVFPRLYATSLKAGERSGEVEAVLRRFLLYQKILGAVRRKVVGAIVYPAVLVGLSIGLITILMTYVIPRFTDFYAGFGGELPVLTRVVVGTANLMKAYFFEGVALIAAGIFFFHRWKGTDAGRRIFDGILLKIPILGGILHQFALSQFTRALATLVGAGTPLVGALEISAGSVANRKIAVAVESVVPKMRQGAELWRSLEETKVFTSLAVEMVKVGEATGALEEMLTNVSEFYDETIESSIQKVINLIEPIILIVMGGVIATILLSVYLPMFTILNQIKA
jgi:type IV pilus assembly protein PilC